jgi:hypothetical protein
MKGNKPAGGAIALAAMLCSSFSGTAQGETWAGSPRFQSFDYRKLGERPQVIHSCSAAGHFAVLIVES